MASLSPEKLLANFVDISLKKQTINKLPSLNQIYDWVRQAIVWHEVLVY
ncbi:MAG: hypothetical protein LRY35_00805 [Clostridiales bacterium]|nr:hypothetical protein [Clostridiales bacterium]